MCCLYDLDTSRAAYCTTGVNAVNWDRTTTLLVDADNSQLSHIAGGCDVLLEEQSHRLGQDGGSRRGHQCLGQVRPAKSRAGTPNTEGEESRYATHDAGSRQHGTAARMNRQFLLPCLQSSQRFVGSRLYFVSFNRAIDGISAPITASDEGQEGVALNQDVDGGMLQAMVATNSRDEVQVR